MFKEKIKSERDFIERFSVGVFKGIGLFNLTFLLTLEFPVKILMSSGWLRTVIRGTLDPCRKRPSKTP